MSEKEIELLRADNKGFILKVTYLKGGSIIIAGIIVALGFMYSAGGFVGKVNGMETRLTKVEGVTERQQSSINEVRAMCNLVKPKTGEK